MKDEIERRRKVDSKRERGEKRLKSKVTYTMGIYLH